MYLIDADALEKEGWMMHRTISGEKNTMECQTKKPTKFPTVEPERKTGKWKDHEKYPNLAYLCSECSYFTTMRSHFCPNCGADMRGEEDGQ